MNYKDIDEKAVEISKEYKRLEAELLEIIFQVNKFKVYRKFGYSSLFQYCVQRLKLSESQTFAFTAVARKSMEVPQIKKSIEKGELTVSKAKRITSVVTKENCDHWIDLAANSTQKKVEREVAIANPKKAIIEKTTYVPSDESKIEKVQVKKDSPRVKLEVGLSEQSMIKLRRAQDILSQKKRSSVSLETTIESLLNEYLKKHDPVEKAKRQKIRGKLENSPTPKSSLWKAEHPTDIRKLASSPKVKKEFASMDDTKSEKSTKNMTNPPPSRNSTKKRRPLPAKIRHQVYLNAEGQCAAVDGDGKRCKSKRFLEIHHIKPIAQGGGDEIENLTLLCTGHHTALHEKLSSSG